LLFNYLFDDYVAFSTMKLLQEHPVCKKVPLLLL